MCQTISSKIVTLPEDFFNELLESRKLLLALQAAGVDNWIGYSEAMALYEEEYPTYDS